MARGRVRLGHPGAHARARGTRCTTPRRTGATSRRRAASRSASIVNTVSSAGLQGQASQIELRRGQGRHRGDDDHRQPRARRATACAPTASARAASPAWSAQARSDIDGQEPGGVHRVRRHEPGQLGAGGGVARVRRLQADVTGQVLRMVGNSLCVYQPWEMGEEFFATDKEGKPDAVGCRPTSAASSTSTSSTR